MLEKFKSLILNDWLYRTVILVLAVLIAFALGYYVSLNTQGSGGETAAVAMSQFNIPTTATTTPPPVSTTTPLDSAVPTTSTTLVMVVGSKTGTKYHLPTCPGAKRIKPENLITFNSIPAAEAAGYTKAANCKGL